MDRSVVGRSIGQGRPFATLSGIGIWANRIAGKPGYEVQLYGSGGIFRGYIEGKDGLNSASSGITINTSAGTVEINELVMRLTLGQEAIYDQDTKANCKLVDDERPKASAKVGIENSSKVSVALRQRGGVLEVMAMVNSEVKVFFVVDSGAADVTISESVAELLIGNGSLTKADFLGTQKYKFANGASDIGKVIRLRTLDLGGYILKDVRAVILTGKDVPLLLGQSALRQLGTWSINANARTLEINPNDGRKR